MVVPIDENFKTAGQKEGLEIWRIKEFRVLPMNPAEFGNFYQGDSYIILSTIKDENEKLHYCVHFWLGSNSSKDEYGTAAIKTVELDDLLGGGPVQYREVQDHESPLFLSYFKNGIKYLKGGYESGFRHVGPEESEPRLFQCKGKRNVRCSQVTMSRDSLNRGDVFILDAGADIYVWMPPDSGRLERIKGIRQACNIRDQENAGRGQVHVLDKDWDSHPEFWRLMGGEYQGKIKTAEQGGVDEGHWLKEKPIVALWRVSDATGRVTVQKVGEGDLSNDMLDSKDAFILDAASGGIYVWVGKQCTMEERKKAMAFAGNYLEYKKLPPWSQVIRVLESAEPAIFTQWFVKPPPNRPTFKPHLFQCSDESGRLIIDEIDNFTQDDLDGDDVMILDGGDTVFLWIGAGANEKEVAAGENIAKMYMETDAIPRPLGAKLKKIAQGNAEDDFTKFFKNWDPKLFEQFRTVQDVQKQMIG